MGEMNAPESLWSLGAAGEGNNSLEAHHDSAGVALYRARREGFKNGEHVTENECGVLVLRTKGSRLSFRNLEVSSKRTMLIVDEATSDTTSNINAAGLSFDGGCSSNFEPETHGKLKLYSSSAVTLS
jgi:hypothetical protein